MSTSNESNASNASNASNVSNVSNASNTSNANEKSSAKKGFEFPATKRTLETWDGTVNVENRSDVDVQVRWFSGHSQLYRKKIDEAELVPMGDDFTMIASGQNADVFMTDEKPRKNADFPFGNILQGKVLQVQFQGDKDANTWFFGSALNCCGNIADLVDSVIITEDKKVIRASDPTYEGNQPTEADIAKRKETFQSLGLIFEMMDAIGEDATEEQVKEFLESKGKGHLYQEMVEELANAGM